MGLKFARNCIVALCLSLCAFPVYAEDSQGKNVFTLGEIEVKDQGEVSKNVTVEKVYNEEMRELNKNTVAQALTVIPGVTMAQTGARNEQTVYVRGFDLKRVPLFLDGIPIYVPYDGYPDLGRFTTYDVSEIVVSKGFTTVLYGPNTEGGAINMISRRPEKAFEAQAGTEYATGGTYSGYANLGTNQKWWYAQGGASYLNSNYTLLSDNFNPLREYKRTENGGQRDNSHYHDGKWNLKVGLTPADGYEYALSFIKQHGAKGNPVYAGYDPDAMVRYWRWPYWDKESWYFTSRTPFGKETYVKTRLYYDKYQNSLWSFDDATYSAQKKKSSFRSDYDDHSRGGSVEAGTTLVPRNSIKAAFHYKEDYHQEHNIPAPYQHFKDEILSAGIEDTISITKRFYSILGIGYDRINTVQAEDTYNAKTEKFGHFDKNGLSSTNPQIGLFYDLTDTGKIFATAEDKSRLPTMKDKYSYRFGTALPNPDLKPEKATTYQIGYQETFWKKISLKSALFHSDVTDMVLLVRVPDPANPGKKVNQNQNVGDVRRYGGELEITAPITEQIEAGFNYSYVFNNNTKTNDKITDIPRHKFWAYAKYTPVKSLSFLGDIEYNSDRYSTADGVETAGSFSVTNIRVIYNIGLGLTAEAGVLNVFDRDYALSEGFPQAGRSYFVDMRYKF